MVPKSPGFAVIMPATPEQAKLRFDYLIDKIARAPFAEAPFRHVQINDFLDDADFRELVATPEIDIHAANDDAGLFSLLFGAGYKIIDFPGCIIDKDAYIRWHRTKGAQSYNNTSCEGIGVTLRLMKTQSAVLTDLTAFLASRAFHACLADKFDVELNATHYDGGIQKYLDGYEISPHPDIRSKALTYMVNINPGAVSETRDHHTHYLRFREPYKYVQAYWDGNPTQDRCWVPWDWCETETEQCENNSIVIFSPANDTLHGVKATYDHLAYQRTQIYGNLWYNEPPAVAMTFWEDYVIASQVKRRRKKTLKSRVGAILPPSIKSMLRPTSGDVVRDRRGAARQKRG